jgi:hypothetical protein
MEERLARLLASYSSTTNKYVLVRLEFALKHPKMTAPPLVARPAQATQSLPETAWDDVEQNLDAVRLYLRRINDQRGKRAAYDPPFAALQRTYLELDQYARAVRWLITIEDHRASP